MAINKTTLLKKAKMKNKSILSIGNNPSENNLSSLAVRRSITNPLFDGTDSIIGELDRIVDETNAYISEEKTKLTNGTTIVDKATKDASGNNIPNTYETKVDATSKLAEAKTYTNDKITEFEGTIERGAQVNKLEKIQVGGTDVAVESKTSNITRDLISSLIGNATTSIGGLLSATDKEKIDLLYSSFNSDDDNNVVDKLKEVLAVFEQYPEATTLTNYLNANYLSKTNAYALAFIEVSDLNADGEITITYDDEALTMVYDDNTGNLAITY